MAGKGGMVQVLMDDHGLGMFLDDVRKNAIRRSLAGAINGVIGDIRKAEVKALPRYFTIRNRYTERGIRFDRAKKTDRDPSGSVFAAADHGGRVGVGVGSYLEGQIEGETKHARKGRYVAIPIKARDTPTRKTTPARWPGRILSRKRAFTINFKNGDIGVFVRVGRRRNSRMDLWWIMRPAVNIKARFPFYLIGQKVAAKVYPRHMHDALSHELARSRQKARQASKGPR